MAERLAYVNGQIVPESAATVSIFDRGFMLGFGVFERTRTFHGELFRLDDHIARLYRSLRMVRVDPGISPAEVRAATLELLAANLPLLGPNDDYSVGHYVSLGPEGGKPTVVMFCEPIEFKRFAREYLDGAHVVTPSIRQIPTQVLDPKLKTTSRLHFLLAQEEARLVDPKAYALLLDLDGNVTETYPGGNFWIVIDGTVITPAGHSILRGVTRTVIGELAEAVGIPVLEQDFQVYDVVNADEAMLTVTSRCILPITRVNKLPIGSGRPGPVVARLQQAWKDILGHDIVGQALSHLEPRVAASVGAGSA
jgi:branched-chain amino acid aminotransferase